MLFEDKLIYLPFIYKISSLFFIFFGGLRGGFIQIKIIYLKWFLRNIWYLRRLRSQGLNREYLNLSKVVVK